jgi:hypothetical protein
MKRTTSRHPSSRRLSLERLENRQLMAGQVLVEVVDGDLRITGDGADNSIEVQMLAPGQYLIHGDPRGGGEPTAIRFGNNVAGVQTVAGVTDDIEINLQAGRDICYIGNIYDGGLVVWVPVDLTIRTGDGDDRVGLFGVNIGDDTLVELGSGRDHLTVTSIYAGTRSDSLDHDLIVLGGNGADETFFNDSVTVRDELRLEMGTDNQADSVSLRNTTVMNDLSIQTGDGNDFVSLLQTVVLDDLSIDTGDGDDRMYLANTTVRDDLTIDAGDDNDTVEIRESSVDEVFARLGSGEDLLVVSHLRGRRADWDGQGDKDELRFAGVLISEYQEIDSFELGSIRL